MLVVIGMNRFLCFPFNCLLIKEVFYSMTDSIDNQEILSNQILSQMILASTFSVSLLTPFIASICISFLF